MGWRVPSGSWPPIASAHCKQVAHGRPAGIARLLRGRAGGVAILYRAAVPLVPTIVMPGPAKDAASSSICATAVAPHDDQIAPRVGPDQRPTQAESSSEQIPQGSSSVRAAWSRHAHALDESLEEGEYRCLR